MERSKALDDEARATILNILSHKSLSAEELVRELKKVGFEKATTTVRHHLDILKDCGLIEIVRMQEVRGAVLKRYASTVKFLGFENSFDSNKYSRAISDTATKLLKIALSIVDRYGVAIKNTDGLSCPYCHTRHGKEYVLIEVLNRALAEMVQRKEFADLMKKVDGREKSKEQKK
ncbi:MAG: ArsR family transcriptional regulator [Nitrososphaerales archaeon]